VKFDSIKKKLIVHGVYYIGECISIKNIKDGKPINKLCISLSRMRGRVVQKINNQKKKLTRIMMRFKPSNQHA
jgi:hypothetical protein